MQPICTHTIGVHSRKPSHSYPVIRLPREFRRLVGAAATIYETTHNGEDAFLVVPHRDNKRSSERAPTTESRLHTAEIKDSNSFEPTFFFESEAKIVTDDERDEIIYHFGSSREVMKKFLGREPIDWEKARSEGTVTTFDQNTDWDNVQIDVKNQRISVTDPDKKSIAILDLKAVASR
jgi:hypothetical protein